MFTDIKPMHLPPPSLRVLSYYSSSFVRHSELMALVQETGRMLSLRAGSEEWEVPPNSSTWFLGKWKPSSQGSPSVETGVRKQKRWYKRNKRPAAVLVKVRMKHSGKCPGFYPSAPVGTGEQKGAQGRCLPNQYGAVQSLNTKDAQVRTRSITADVWWTCSPGPCSAGATASCRKAK